MPSKPKKQCGYPGCPRLTDGGKCEEHRRKASARYEKERNQTDARRWHHSRRMRTATTMFLNGNPLCAQCLREGRDTGATIVDHIVPHKGDYGLFWDESNWQSMCKHCHDLKTSKEDGGFGNQ